LESETPDAPISATEIVLMAGAVGLVVTLLLMVVAAM
jgi:hypothetical protein